MRPDPPDSTAVRYGDPKDKTIPRSRTWQNGSTGDLAEIGARLMVQHINHHPGKA